MKTSTVSVLGRRRRGAAPLQAPHRQAEEAGVDEAVGLGDHQRDGDPPGRPVDRAGVAPGDVPDAQQQVGGDQDCGSRRAAWPRPGGSWARPAASPSELAPGAGRHQGPAVPRVGGAVDGGTAPLRPGAPRRSGRRRAPRTTGCSNRSRGRSAPPPSPGPSGRRRPAWRCSRRRRPVRRPRGRRCRGSARRPARARPRPPRSRVRTACRAAASRGAAARRGRPRRRIRAWPWPAST